VAFTTITLAEIVHLAERVRIRAETLDGPLPAVDRGDVLIMILTCSGRVVRATPVS
jgi:hypothetical protein